MTSGYRGRNVVRRRTDMMPHLPSRLRSIVELTVAGSKKADPSSIMLTGGFAIGGLLLEAVRRPAAAASAQSTTDPGDVVYELEWYLRQAMEWIRASIDSTLRAYHLDASQLYKITLTLFVLAIFVCLMVKAFTLGKLAAERASRSR